MLTRRGYSILVSFFRKYNKNNRRSLTMTPVAKYLQQIPDGSRLIKNSACLGSMQYGSKNSAVAGQEAPTAAPSLLVEVSLMAVCSAQPLHPRLTRVGPGKDRVLPFCYSLELLYDFRSREHQVLRRFSDWFWNLGHQSLHKLHRRRRRRGR